MASSSAQLHGGVYRADRKGPPGNGHSSIRISQNELLAKPVDKPTRISPVLPH